MMRGGTEWKQIPFYAAILLVKEYQVASEEELCRAMVAGVCNEDFM